MKRTEVLQGLRMMKFEELYERTRSRSLNQAEAAEILVVSERTFRRWRDRFEADGAEGGGVSLQGVSPFVFCKEDGTRYGSLKTSFSTAARRAEIKNLRWHDLRRTCGCRLIQEYGLDLYKVSRWLGHKSTTVTEHTYAFLRVDDLHEAIRVGTNVGTDPLHSPPPDYQRQ